MSESGRSQAPSSSLTKTGWLYKWTNYLKGYQKRYFVLANGKLCYYKNEAEIYTCRGEISLLSARICTEDSCSFLITKGGTETFHLRAENEVERQTWVTALELAKRRAITEFEEDEAASTECVGDLSSERDDLNELLKPLLDKLNHLKACTEKINKHAAALHKTLADLENSDSIGSKRTGSASSAAPENGSVRSSTAGSRSQSPQPNTAHLKQLQERTALFKITLIATVNSCNQYAQFAQTHSGRWFKKLQKEHEARLRLEEIVEQLAKQHSHLEEKAKKQAKGSANDEEDDEFYDAEETATDFFVSIPGKAQRVSQTPSTLVKAAWPGGAQSVRNESKEQLFSNQSTGSSKSSGSNSNDMQLKSDDLKSNVCLKRNEFLLANDLTSSEREEDESSDSDEQASKMIATSVITRRKSKTTEMEVTVIQNTEHDQQEDKSDDSQKSFDKVDSNQLVSTVAKPSRRRRTQIPPRPNQSLNLWSFMKNCIGKELTKIPMPVNFNEPLSLLQRLTEDFEYADLLHKCARISDPAEQLIYIAAFCVSHYATTGIRTCKPFNPLLGETFECDRTDDLGWKSLAEQVSHHPPMMAMHCIGKGWFFYSEFGISSKFRGKYLQVNPIDINHLEFPELKYHYSWHKVTTTVNNIIVGKLWVDNHGDMTITNHNTGHQCLLKFAPYSYFSRDTPRKVTGVVLDKEGTAKWVLKGSWDQKMEASKVIETRDSSKSGTPIIESSTPKIIWKRSNPPPNSAMMYNLTQLAIELNEPEEGVAPTDSRHRPDQRAMEMGKWDEANKVKVQLEQKQREVRRKREELIESTGNSELHEYRPCWFEKAIDPYTGVSFYKYKDEYWQHKERQDWSRCPDIYSLP